MKDKNISLGIGIILSIIVVIVITFVFFVDEFYVLDQQTCVQYDGVVVNQTCQYSYIDYWRCSDYGGEILVTYPSTPDDKLNINEVCYAQFGERVSFPGNVSSDTQIPIGGDIFP